MPALCEPNLDCFETEAMPHLNALFRTALSLTRNRLEAEDLVQEVYLQAWKSFHQYQPGTNCRAWLFKILSNKFKHYCHKNKNFKFIEDSDDWLNVLVFKPTITETLRDEEIILSLKKVPPLFREVFLLTDVAEFSYKEAAEILDIPIGTVMSRVSRGRALLRNELMKLAESYEFNFKTEKLSKRIVKFLLGKLKTI